MNFFLQKSKPPNSPELSKKAIIIVSIKSKNLVYINFFEKPAPTTGQNYWVSGFTKQNA